MMQGDLAPGLVDPKFQGAHTDPPRVIISFEDAVHRKVEARALPLLRTVLAAESRTPKVQVRDLLGFRIHDTKPVVPPTNTLHESLGLHGDKLYQERARAALPLLVRQAMAGEPITYESLARELGMPNARNLNYPLGTIGGSLKKLAEEWQEEIPQIQALVVNKSSLMPGPGIGSFVHSSKADFVRLPRQRQIELVKKAQTAIHAYPRWHYVLRALNLTPIASRAESLVSSAQAFGGGKESESHRKLKEYVRDHPEIIGVRHTREKSVERGLPSGDIVDVSFESSRHWIAVEVKSTVSADADLARGLFQCIKYKAVMSAVLASKGERKDVDAILVVEGRLQRDLLSLANSIGVQFIELSRKGGGYQRVL